jgi:heat shock protein HslJ
VPASAFLRRLVAIVAIVVVLTGCDVGMSPSSPPSGNALSALAGTSWIVKSVDRRSPVPGAVPTATFDAERVSGTGGCNQYGGPYRLDPSTGQLAIRELVSTDMGCVQPGVTTFESVFLRALGGANHATVGPDGELVLDGTAGRVLLVPLEHP